MSPLCHLKNATTTTSQLDMICETNGYAIISEDRKLFAAVNIYSFKGTTNIWLELLLFTRFTLNNKPIEHEKLVKLISEISNHGFHSASIGGCLFCKLLSTDQEENKTYLLEHYKVLIRQIIMSTLSYSQRVQLVLKTEEWSKLLFYFAVGILFAVVVSLTNTMFKY